MTSGKTGFPLIKFLSLFSVIRGYNLVIIILAQYLSAIFILAPQKKITETLFDGYLFLIVLSSSFVIASGYIINNFYDNQKDLINRPNKTLLDQLVSQKTKLNTYFTLNIVAVFLGWIVSWRAALFFSVYIFLIWFYSHKVKKTPITGNLMSCFLIILPFFAILVYFYYNKINFLDLKIYKDNLIVILAHASFLFLLLVIREIIKDLENLKGDIANNYKTIPIIYGETTAKKIITSLTFLVIIPVYILIEIHDVGYMDTYFYISFIVLTFFLLRLKKSRNQKDYLFLHNVLKVLLVSGVFSIVLINPKAILNLISC